MLAFVGSVDMCGQIDSLQLLTDGYFRSPVDYTIKIAGSFGELRSNHFHAGIDIKSRKGTEGDTIRAAADGHVSRIKIQRGSYGKALYIDHPNGYTTVYAHLQRFAPEIEAYIRDRQRATESYEIEVYPNADRLPIGKGEYVGILGNTGRSYGPHLHFEIRETVSEVPQNPYLHGIGPADTKAPLLYAVAVHGLDKDLTKVWSETQYINSTGSGSYGPSHTFQVPTWRAGMALQTFDLMDGADNKNGVYHLKMYVDDTLHFEMKMDSIGFDETNYINSFIDYGEKKQQNRTMVKCYRQLGTDLRLYRTLKNNGFFKVYEKTARQVRFEATDFFGNTAAYECKIYRREAEANDLTNTSYTHKVRYSEAYDLQMGLCRVQIPAGTTDNTLWIDYKEGLKDNDFHFTLGSPDQAAYKPIEIKIPLRGIWPSLREKAVLVYKDSKTPTSYGGEIVADSLVAKVDNLGDFALEIDTIPPTITPLEYKKTISASRADFKFRLQDNYATRGAAADPDYDVYIDEVWVASPLKALGDVLTVPLEGLSVGEHQIRIVATDDRGNATEWTSTFVVQ